MPRTLTVAGLLACLALLVAGCGDGDDETTAPAPPSKEQGAKAKSQKKDKDAERSGSPKADGGKDGSGSGDPSGFTPHPHEDSATGSAPVRNENGDNSVQDFGEETGGTEFEQAAENLHNFFDARFQHEWEAACTYLESNFARSLEEPGPQGQPASCAYGLEAFTRPGTQRLQRIEAAQADVLSLRAENESGFLIYRDGDGVVYGIAVVKEDGEWKLAGLAGLPLN